MNKCGLGFYYTTILLVSRSELFLKISHTLYLVQNIFRLDYAHFYEVWCSQVFQQFYSSMILNIPISSRPDDLHKFLKFFLPDGQYVFIKGRDARGNRNACAVVKSHVDVTSGIEIHLSNFIKILIA